MIIGIDNIEIYSDTVTPLTYVTTLSGLVRCSHCDATADLHWFEAGDREIHMVLCTECHQRDLVMYTPREDGAA
jgi:hypothetical protein